MKTATQNLEYDHTLILRLIEVMERIAKSADPIVDHLELTVKVIREFADGLHHAKEEKLLFPLMVQKGFSNESGPVAVMLYEHQSGRNYVKGIAEGISRLRLGDKQAVKDVSFNMTGYADLLKKHIAKENNVLFPMADKVFNASEQEELILAFMEIENSRQKEYGTNEYVNIIAELEFIYAA